MRGPEVPGIKPAHIGFQLKAKQVIEDALHRIIVII